jgi:hypothetical protein
VKSVGSLMAGGLLLGFWILPKSGNFNAFAGVGLPLAAPKGAVEPSLRPSPSSSPVARTAGVNRRLKITVEVNSPGELLVEDGQKVVAQQVIVDRKIERGVLTAQLDEVKLSIEQLRTAPAVSQVPPAAVNSLKALPKAQYLEESAQVTAATAKLRDMERKFEVALKVAAAPLPETGKVRVGTIAVQQAEENIRKQQRKIDALGTLEDLDPAIRQHEEAVMAKLQQGLAELRAKLEPEEQQEALAKVTRASALEAVRLELTTAQRDLELAKARLGAAAEKRRQLEYDYEIRQAERAEQVQRSELERVKLLESGKLQAHDREYQVAQLVLKRDRIQRQIEALATIKVPHAGTIRRVKLAGQKNGLLQYEIVLVYGPGETAPKTNEWKEETER